MGRGSSKVSGGGGGGSARANTPSGVSMDQFNQMSMDQKVQTINNILNDPSITVPNYLDDSDTSKVLYALGMNNKPTVVDDATLDSMQGRELFRTVYERGSMPPPSSQMIADQIRNGDYTQMSGSGGSAHGRALYFATDFLGSRYYGDTERNALIMRGKLNPNAKIANERNLFNSSNREWQTFQSKYSGYNTRTDGKALFALSKGYDGWFSGNYTMMINRGALTMSSQNKSITTGGQTKSGRLRKGSTYANSWGEAQNMS